MKVLFCTACMDIRAFDVGSFTSCRCGNMAARWDDPDKGTVIVRAMLRDKARIIGLNNSFLEIAARANLPPELWRELHEDATEAPGYIFDKNKRACWACIMRVGETSDIKWDEKDPFQSEAYQERVRLSTSLPPGKLNE